MMRAKTQTVTFTELRNNAKAFFDKVEAGETLEIYRNGKPIAILQPYQQSNKVYWQKAEPPLSVGEVSLTEAWRKDKEESDF